MTEKFQTVSDTYKVGGLIRMLIITCACEVAIPAIAFGIGMARNAPVDATGHQLMAFIFILEACAVSAGIAAIVKLGQRKRAARVLGCICIAGLLPLAVLGIMLGIVLARMLASGDLTAYLDNRGAGESDLPELTDL